MMRKKMLRFMPPRHRHRRLKAFDNTTRTDVITGYYQVPSPGRYFLEIIGLLCNDFAFDFDFNPICLEDPVHNHLTAPSTFIDAKLAATEPSSSALSSSSGINSNSNSISISLGEPKPVGYWKWVNKTDPIQMNTRYQGQNCRGSNSNELRCMESSRMDRFTPYEFEWSDVNDSILHHDSGADNMTICVGGHSHARELRTHLVYWLEHFNITNVKADGWVQMSYPTDMNNRAGNKAKSCNKTIVAVGQWSAGKRPRYAKPGTTFPEYREQLRTAIKTWQSLNVDFYFRKVHYNPLGDLITACPPVDHRSPPVIDGYNEIIKNLSREYNVTFIDTSNVMDSMWDSAEDFCHYRGEEGRVEAFYILQQIFNDVKMGR